MSKTEKVTVTRKVGGVLNTIYCYVTEGCVTEIEYDSAQPQVTQEELHHIEEGIAYINHCGM